jgi:hypothetical protein
MFRLFAMLVVSAFPALAAEEAQPITTDTSPAGKLLTKWWKEGTAAGHAGDWYDNRDREHSPLNTKLFPQLKKVQYSEEEKKLRRDWALQPRTLPHVTFGNSSTSAPPMAGGSNPRMYYLSSEGLKLLETHYRRNNLYIYPEHRDHDPGRNGVDPDGGNAEGWGDLYPTNTPYLLISQGSSGSDQPFMRATAFTLAAFRPEVKKVLVDKGFLMPTVQYLFRSTNKSLNNKDEYFTGLAHPTVFDGKHVDTLAMMNAAHDMGIDSIPPLAALRVLKEEEPINGKDFFDLPGRTEKLADTAHVIARVWRGRAETRTVLLSAAPSSDANDKPLTFRWVLLRGDPEAVTITPRGKGNVEAEIVLKYPQRRPVAPGSVIESSRVDIGVFADNGTVASVPAFFTYVALEDEERTANRIRYGATTSVEIKDKKTGETKEITRRNYVDPRLAAPKNWTDTYAADGSWTRTEGKKETAFTPEGWMITARDAMGRPSRAVTVIYKQPPGKPGPINTSPLMYEPGDEEITFAYVDGKRVIQDRVKVKERGR